MKPGQIAILAFVSVISSGLSSTAPAAAAEPCLTAPDRQQLQSIFQEIQDCPMVYGPVPMFGNLQLNMNAHAWGYQVNCVSERAEAALKLSEAAMPPDSPVSERIRAILTCPRKKVEDTLGERLPYVKKSCVRPALADATKLLAAVAACPAGQAEVTAAPAPSEAVAGAAEALGLSPAQRPAAYASILATSVVNSSQLRQEYDDRGFKLPSADELASRVSAGWPSPHWFAPVVRNRFEQVPFVCRFFGQGGCLVPTYLDASALIHLRAIKANDGREPDPETQIGNQLELGDFVRRTDGIARSTGQGRLGHADAFKKLGYLERDGRVGPDRDAIATAYAKLSASRGSAASRAVFVSEVLRHPRGFQILPELHRLALASAADPAGGGVLVALEDASARALVLMIAAFSDTADFRLDSYPFADELVSPSSLLDVNRLAAELSAIGRWPGFKSLTEAERARLGGIYVAKTARGAWKVKGSYDDRSNTIALDFSASFYENVYVLYHELWHVAWNHSPEVRGAIGSIARLAGAGDAGALQRALSDLIRRNELLAIDEQNRLFHASGALATDWGGTVPESARGWHDSYLGGPGYANQLKMSDRRDGYYIGADGARLEWQLSLFFYPVVAFVHQSVSEAWNSLQKRKHEGERRKLDESFWKEQYRAHLEWFGKIYALPAQAPASATSDLAAELLLKDAKFEKLPPTPLTCRQERAILDALGSDWRFGVPFDYVIVGGEACRSPDRLAPTDFGTEGSHPGTEGSHPDFGGFPSFEGPDGP